MAVHISGLVISVTEDATAAEAALAALRAAGPFQLGEVMQRGVAVVLETADAPSAHTWHEWAQALPGVAAVEVVFVHWEEADAEISHADA